MFKLIYVWIYAPIPVTWFRYPIYVCISVCMYVYLPPSKRPQLTAHSFVYVQKMYLMHNFPQNTAIAAAFDFHDMKWAIHACDMHAYHVCNMHACHVCNMHACHVYDMHAWHTFVRLHVMFCLQPQFVGVFSFFSVFIVMTSFNMQMQAHSLHGLCCAHTQKQQIHFTRTHSEYTYHAHTSNTLIHAHTSNTLHGFKHRTYTTLSSFTLLRKFMYITHKHKRLLTLLRNALHKTDDFL